MFLRIINLRNEIANFFCHTTQSFQWKFYVFLRKLTRNFKKKIIRNLKAKITKLRIFFIMKLKVFCENLKLFLSFAYPQFIKKIIFASLRTPIAIFLLS